MKTCVITTVIIPLIVLVYASSALAQENSNSGVKSSPVPVSSGWQCTIPTPHAPLVPRKEENLTLNEGLEGWFSNRALDMKVFWMAHHTKLDTTYSCACTFNYDAHHKMTNVKILKSSGSESVDRDVLNAVRSLPGLWWFYRLGEHTIRVDFSNDPSELNFPIFSMSVLDETDNSKNPGHTTK
jgi:hypothetical protein